MATRRPVRPSRHVGRAPRRGGIRHLPILVTAALVGMLVVAFVGVRWYLSPTVAQPSDQAQANQVVSALASIPVSELQTTGQGTSNIHLDRISAPALVGAGGKPQVLYVGAEYCPYCAAERWALAVALSRFGTLTGVGLTRSSSTDAFPNTPTITFHGSTYSSPYLDFVAVEIADRQGAPLERLSPDQQALMLRYDAPPYSAAAGGIPFVDVGNHSVTSGAAYSPGLLQGMDQQQVVRALRDPASPQARAILGSANVLTAAICQLTGEHPTNVCGNPAIQSIQTSIGASSR